MKIFTWDDIEKGLEQPLWVDATMGVFDGFHRGHDSLFRRTLSDHSLPSLVISFVQNPKKILGRQPYLGDLLTLESKIAGFRAHGFDYLLLIDFSLEFSKMSGKDFFFCLKRSFRFRDLVIGYDFSFGKNSGTPASEIQLLIDSDTSLTTMPPVYEGSVIISSSEIRAALFEGRLDWALTLLGKDYKVAIPQNHLEYHEGAWHLPRSCIDQVVPLQGSFIVKDGEGETRADFTPDLIRIKGNPKRLPPEIIFFKHQKE